MYKGTLCIYIQNGSTFDISTMSFDGVIYYYTPNYILINKIK